MVSNILIEIVTAIGRFLLNPVVYIAIVVAIFLGYRRVKQERKFFNRRIIWGWTRADRAMETRMALCLSYFTNKSWCRADSTQSILIDFNRYIFPWSLVVFHQCIVTHLHNGNGNVSIMGDVPVQLVVLLVEDFVGRHRFIRRGYCDNYDFNRSKCSSGRYVNSSYCETSNNA
ncbi:hypothetical protein LSPH26S_04752 [Lysinibacillus sphaericus]